MLTVADWWEVAYDLSTSAIFTAFEWPPTKTSGTRDFEWQQNLHRHGTLRGLIARLINYIILVVAGLRRSWDAQALRELLWSSEHTGEKVDGCRNGRLCCWYGQLYCRFWQQIGNNLNSTACRGCLCCQCVRSQSDKVDHVEFNFVAAMLSRSAHTSLVDVQLNSTMRLISGTFHSTPLPWLPVLSNIEPPALRRKAATDKLVEKIINECRVILATLCAVSWLTSYGSWHAYEKKIGL